MLVTLHEGPRTVRTASARITTSNEAPITDTVFAACR